MNPASITVPILYLDHWGVVPPKNFNEDACFNTARRLPEVTDVQTRDDRLPSGDSCRASNLNPWTLINDQRKPRLIYSSCSSIGAPAGFFYAVSQQFDVLNRRVGAYGNNDQYSKLNPETPVSDRSSLKSRLQAIKAALVFLIGCGLMGIGLWVTRFLRYNAGLLLIVSGFVLVGHATSAWLDYRAELYREQHYEPSSQGTPAARLADDRAARGAACDPRSAYGGVHRSLQEEPAQTRAETQVSAGVVRFPRPYRRNLVDAFPDRAGQGRIDEASTHHAIDDGHDPVGVRQLLPVVEAKPSRRADWVDLHGRDTREVV